MEREERDYLLSPLLRGGGGKAGVECIYGRTLRETKQQWVKGAPSVPDRGVQSLTP